MTACSYPGWKRKKPRRAGSLSPIRLKKSPKRAKSWPSEPARLKKGHRIPLDVKVGDRILFGKFTGSEIEIDDQEYLILREEEILVKVSGMAKAASGKK